MVLAVLAPVCAAQKHPQQQHARNGHLRKEERSSPRLFSSIFAMPALKTKGIFWRQARKCPPSAKVGLEPYGELIDELRRRGLTYRDIAAIHFCHFRKEVRVRRSS
jgi:hypothetical protein